MDRRRKIGTVLLSAEGPRAIGSSKRNANSPRREKGRGPGGPGARYNLPSQIQSREAKNKRFVRAASGVRVHARCAVPKIYDGLRYQDFIKIGASRNASLTGRRGPAFFLLGRQYLDPSARVSASCNRGGRAP